MARLLGRDVEMGTVLDQAITPYLNYTADTSTTTQASLPATPDQSTRPSSPVSIHHEDHAATLHARQPEEAAARLNSVEAEYGPLNVNMPSHMNRERLSFEATPNRRIPDRSEDERQKTGMRLGDRSISHINYRHFNTEARTGGNSLDHFYERRNSGAWLGDRTRVMRTTDERTPMRILGGITRVLFMMNSEI
jgi:hypothetical protein